MYLFGFRFKVCSFVFSFSAFSSFFFFLSAFVDFSTVNSALFTYPQILLFNNFFIKNESYGTIHTFKNYFTTVFSVFSFQFQQNKLYLNIRYISKNNLLFEEFVIKSLWIRCSVILEEFIVGKKLGIVALLT